MDVLAQNEPGVLAPACAGPESQKFRVGWGVTSRCNMGCSFCYSRTCRDEGEDIGFCDWARFLDQSHLLVESINYGTGENSLRPEWFDLVSLVRNAYPSIRQAVTTNGYLSQAARESSRAMRIIEQGIDEVDVSLDWAQRDDFCLFRGHSRAYDWVMETLALCADLGKRTTIVLMGIAGTLDSTNLEGVFAVADKFHADVRINLYRPVSKPGRLAPPSLAQVIRALDWISSNHRIREISDPLFSAVLTPDRTIADPSGISSIRILPNGKICPSTYLVTSDFHLGSIRDLNPLERLRQVPLMRTICLRQLPDACSDCSIRSRCLGGAIDRRFLWYGSLDERDPYCPLRDASVENPRLRDYAVSPSGFQSIHDGYLPTMFFSPRE